MTERENAIVVGNPDIMKEKAEVDPVGPGRDESLCVFSVSASRWEKRNTHNRSSVKKTDRDTQRPARVLF